MCCRVWEGANPDTCKQDADSHIGPKVPPSSINIYVSYETLVTSLEIPHKASYYHWNVWPAHLLSMSTWGHFRNSSHLLDF